MKVVINKCFGGFGLSHKAVMRYAELAGFTLYPWIDGIEKRIYGDKAVIGNEALRHNYSRVPVDDLPRTKSSGWPDLPEGAFWHEGDLSRTDPILVRVVEELGEASYGHHAKLAVVEIPDGIDWEIDEYDGSEKIAEVHRTWG